MTPRLRLSAAAVGGVLGTVAALAKKMRRSGRRQCQTGAPAPRGAFSRGSRHDPDGQQHPQRLALRRNLAGSITQTGFLLERPGANGINRTQEPGKRAITPHCKSGFAM